MSPAPTMRAESARRADESTTHACAYCGETTRADIGRMTLWLGERLVVVQDVPSRVCTGCGETFYEGDILARIERLQTGGGHDIEPIDTVEADVYAWNALL